MSTEPVLEIQHKRQQSHDSGTYQDWPIEEQKEANYNSNVSGEFVTVVAVENNDAPEKPFVTVLSIDPLNQDSEEVLVYRLPGERLGFGLKFDGGLKTVEKVGRLYIQSCAVDSPASRTSASWGPLSPGDEIIAIDGDLVSEMTRIDCVRALKESNVVIKLRVRQGKTRTEQKANVQHEHVEAVAPPIPPRKFSKKKETAEPPQAFEDKKSSPPVLPRSKYNVPLAEVYTDLLSQESQIPTESESDDTGSSISTVVSRISSTPTTSNSSFSDGRSINSFDITTPPTPTSKNTPFDLDKVLEPFLQLEREFSSSTINESSIFTKLVEASNMISGKDEGSTLKPPESFQDAETASLSEVSLEKEGVQPPQLPPKPSPRQEANKSGVKKRPPPPPPPPNTTTVSLKANRSPSPQQPPTPPPLPQPTSRPLQRPPHLPPRLIDFVPKDRTDLVVPSPVHPVATSIDKELPTVLPRVPSPEAETKEPGTTEDGESLTTEKGLENESPKPVMDSTNPVEINQTTCGNKMITSGMSEQFVAVAPPSFSRLPPDGHEFPLHYDEIARESKEFKPIQNNKPQLSPTIQYKNLVKRKQEVIRKTSLPTTTDTYKHGLWRNDEKSEKSVRDKIALFSTVGADQKTTTVPLSKKLNKFKSSDDVSTTQNGFIQPAPPASEKSLLASAPSIIKKGMAPYHSLLDVTNDYEGTITKKESPLTQSSTDLTSYAYDSGPKEYSTLPRKSETHKNSFEKHNGPQNPNLTRAVSFSGSTKLHSRSQSLVDVGSKPQTSLAYKCSEEARRSSLNQLIEQRKKSMSKLRGLVIPEKVVEVPVAHFVVDLPEIQSKDCLIPNMVPPHKTARSSLEKMHAQPPVNPNKHVPVIPVPPWKAENSINDIPKYSPAFKRKSLALYYGTPSSVSSSLSSSREELRSCFSDGTKPSRSVRNLSPPNNQTEPKSLESITSPSMSDHSFDFPTSSSSCSPNSKTSDCFAKMKNHSSAPGQGNGDARATEEESDNDSAVSSSRSSISHGYTPPQSPMPDYHRLENSSHTTHNGLMLKRTLSSETTASTSSNGSTLTSGSQASCSSIGTTSSVDSRRVLKPQSLEAINRKNVLSSAKFSSGLDVKGSFPKSQSIKQEEPNSPHSLSPITVVENEVVDDDGGGDEEESKDDISHSPTDHLPVTPDKQPDTDDSLVESIETGDSSKEESGLALEEEMKTDSYDSPTIQNYSPPLTGANQNETKSQTISNDYVSSLELTCPTNAFRSRRERETIYQNGSKQVENGVNKSPDKLKSVKGGSSSASSTKTVNVNNIKKVFEKTDNFNCNGRIKGNFPSINTNFQHPRVSSIDSTTSDDSFVPTPSTPYGSISNLQKEQQFGSITSLASSTSLISQQELSQLIEEANHALEDGGNSHEVVVVILHRDSPGGSIGITLAGGADYEAKEITVHKVLVGSPAERDGRIQKGDRILSINGKSMKGLTHYESLAILKAPRPEVVLVVSRHKADTHEDSLSPKSLSSIRSSRFSEPKYSLTALDKGGDLKWGPVVTVVLNKDGAGLGFSLEGGKASPFGDQPLTVKKIFTGGCAEKCGQLFAGDELINVNNIDLSELSRIEAWALMKRLPNGKVYLNVRHPIT